MYLQLFEKFRTLSIGHRSVGRTDFTGGSFEDIARSIREKLYKLPDDTKVYPGHMGVTTIGIEKKNNPFVPEN